MIKQTIIKSIYIDASPDKVWSVFTNANITRQMGGEYVTDWKVGSSFAWKGQDGKIYTHGTILLLEPGKILKHNLLDLNNKSVLLSEITYDFKQENAGTTILAKEEINYEVTNEQLKDINQGWEMALQTVKEIAEKL